MSNPSELVEVKVSTDAASNFVETYYPALNSEEGRKGITKFYIRPSAEATAEADISYNGNVMANPTELQELFEKQITSAYYKVDTFDCEVINSNYNVGADARQLAPDKEGRKLSILVVVGGTVRYGDDGEPRVFTENIVLVPNWEAQGPKAAKGLKKFLIQSQNFRLLL